MGARRRVAWLTVTLLICISLGAAAEPRKLAIVLRTDGADVGEVDNVLHGAGLALGQDPPLQIPPGLTVLETQPISDVEQLFDVAAVLEGDGGPAGVVAAGVLVFSMGDRRLIYSGRLMVNLRPGASESALRAWESRNQVLAESGTTWGRQRFFGAPFDPDRLLDIVNDLPGSVGVVIPIHHDVGPPRRLVANEIGGYHVLPRDRTVAGVIRADRVDRDDLLDAFGLTQPLKVVGQIEFYKFDTTDEMMQELREARDQSLVVSAGPALSIDPPRIVSNQLIVVFNAPIDRHTATVLLGGHGLNPVRRLPYFENGYLFRTDEASFDIYEAAADLLGTGHVELAVPDIYSENRSLCGSGDCTPRNHQKYLEMIRAPEAWKFVSGFDRDTVIGIFDEGVDTSGTERCEELNVLAILRADHAELPYCYPVEGAHWCVDQNLGGCKGKVPIANTTHGFAIAAAAASIADESDDPLLCDTLVGSAPGAPLLDVQRPDYSLDTVVASALWWMAGGKESGYAPALNDANQDRRAKVLNLSFQRDYRSVLRCPVIHPELCAEVCVEGANCSVVDAVLQVLTDTEETMVERRVANGIRKDGIVVVSAMAPTGDSDFASSGYTVATGTVTTDGEPFFGTTTFHDAGTYLDVVAPLGTTESFYLDGGTRKAGGSSTATAVTSGVTALMFDVNPDLTAAQARCILRQEAQRPRGAGDMWARAKLNKWYADSITTEDCQFGFMTWRSNCLGHGMVDAFAAVQAAYDCRLCTLPLLSSDGGIVGTRRVPCPVFSLGGEDPGDPCHCDAAGKPINLPLRIDPQSLCLNCTTDDPKAGPALEIILKLLKCVHGELCICDPQGSDCASLEVVNRSRSDYRDVTMELCLGSRCWPLPGEWSEWPEGETLTISFPRDLEIHEAWLGPRSPELCARSSGKPIGFRRTEEDGNEDCSLRESVK